MNLFNSPHTNCEALETKKNKKRKEKNPKK